MELSKIEGPLSTGNRCGENSIVVEALGGNSYHKNHLEILLGFGVGIVRNGIAIRHSCNPTSQLPAARYNPAITSASPT